MNGTSETHKCSCTGGRRVILKAKVWLYLTTVKSLFFFWALINVFAKCFERQYWISVNICSPENMSQLQVTAAWQEMSDIRKGDSTSTNRSSRNRIKSTRESWFEENRISKHPSALLQRQNPSKYTVSHSAENRPRERCNNVTFPDYIYIQNLTDCLHWWCAPGLAAGSCPRLGTPGWWQ